MTEMTDWTPIVFVTFKLLVLGIGMFFAIKWHYDKGMRGKDRKNEKRAVLRASGKIVAVFVPVLLVLIFVTFFIAKHLGLDLNFP